MKAFHAKKIGNAKGLLLPYSEFRLFSDLDSTSFTAEKAEKIVRKAEALLEKDFPLLPATLYREYVTNGNRSNYEELFF